MQKNQNQNNKTKDTDQSEEPHIPVLLAEVIHCLSPKKGDIYLDLTAGYGGHAAAIFDSTGAAHSSVLVDRDENATQALHKKFAGQKTEVINTDFYTASQQLVAEGRQFDIILADLGVSSPHLNESDRGFSLAQDGPLDMRMDQSQTLWAQTIVNTYPEAKIAQILKNYGEEPKSQQIAKLIVHNRPFVGTLELAQVVSRAWPGHSKVHPATRTFQALRIAVNDELGLLERSLPLWYRLLAPDGRLAVISFHSLEDRIVKQFMADKAGNGYDAELRLLTKRPITAGAHELVSNPRSRSAKLRAAAKIKNQKI
jgi:16S rRNA (cytosine1402-N4)-methyltransferase